MKNYTFKLPLMLSPFLLVMTLSGCGGGATKHHSFNGGTSPHSFHMNSAKEYQQPLTLDVSAIKPLGEILTKLESKKVIYVGETHNRYDHHLNQLEIIKHLASKKGKKLAIGVEFFQRPFQKVLDDYVAGRIDERQMLRDTEYFSRWRFDYRLYRPIFQYAQENQIPIIALDVATETRIKVGRNGLTVLSEDETKNLPQEMDTDNKEYREFIKFAFNSYHSLSEDKFENFLQAQILRDETMAETAANYLANNKGSSMVILAGTGHLISGLGIPNRLQRRISMPQSIVLNDLGQRIKAGVADYLLFPDPIPLPPAGMLGIQMQESISSDGVVVANITEGSAAEHAGIEQNDKILAIDGSSVTRISDIKIALLDKNKGDEIEVLLEREGLFSTKQHRLNAKLR